MVSVPYGSANKNPRGDTGYLGHLEIAVSSVPDFTSYPSPHHYFGDKQSFLNNSKPLRYANISRAARPVTWIFRSQLPSR